MATEQALQLVSIPVAADSSSYQYLFMSVDSNGRLARTGAAAQADGVLQDKPAAAGRPGQFAIAGISKVVAGGTVTNGYPVASDSAGRAVNATSGDNICGVALQAGTVGVIISVLLKTQNANALA